MQQDRIAIISDVHGNMTAFRAVLADIEQRGIETIYCLGDMVGKGPNSAEVADLTRTICPVILRGNWEDAVAHRTFEPGRIHYWHQQQLGAERLAWVGQLPMAYEFWLSGQRIRLIHATPQNLHSKQGIERSYAEWQRMLENTPLLGLDTPTPDVVICGHTHRSFAYNLFDHGKLILNSGSVGCSTDLVKMGCYLILEGQLGQTEPAAFSYQFVRFPYDIEAAIDEARQADMPEMSFYEFEQQNADYRGAMPAYQQMMAARRARERATQ